MSQGKTKMFLCFTLVLLLPSFNLAEVTSDLKEVIDSITAEYEDNLKRAIQNEGIRRLNIRRGKNSYPLNDALVSEGDSDIELKNLVLSPAPDVRVTKLSVNFELLTLDVVLNFGTLKVEGDYEANNRTLRRLLAVTHSGGISIKISNVVASGRIGLFLREDSFVAENYDLDFEAGEVTVTVHYQGENGNVVESEITELRIEKTLAYSFWNQLTDVLTNIFKQQLGAVIVEDSVTETMADLDNELREHSRQLYVKANRLLDSVLCSAKGNIVSHEFRSIKTPAFTITFKNKKQGEHIGVLSTTTGYIKDLSTLTRIRDMSIYEDDKDVVVYGNIELRDFKHGYDNFTAEYLQNSVTGTIRTSIYHSTIFVKMAVSKREEKMKCRIEKIKVTNLNDIDMDSSGLGSLSWLIDRLRNWVIANLRGHAISVFEDHLRMSFEKAAGEIDCAALLNN